MRRLVLCRARRLFVALAPGAASAASTAAGTSRGDADRGAGRARTASRGAHTHGFTVARSISTTPTSRSARGSSTTRPASRSTTCGSSARRRASSGCNSFPTSDQGEPHTQEHLLLGKGDRGRRLGSSEAMALARVSAFTEQWRTAYHFHTVAGTDVFWPVFENQLDALLQPRLHRRGDPARGAQLRRRQGATTASSASRRRAPSTTRWCAPTSSREAVALPRRWPARLRREASARARVRRLSPRRSATMTPEDIRTFHDDALPPREHGHDRRVSVGDAARDVLDQHRRGSSSKEAGRTGKAMTEARAAQAGARAAAARSRSSSIRTATPRTRARCCSRGPRRAQLDDDRAHAARACSSTRSPATRSTPLYKKLIDSKTRAIDLGASALSTDVSSRPGPAGDDRLIDGVKADKLDDKTIGDVRTLDRSRSSSRIAKLPDGDPELVAFDARVHSRVVDCAARLAKFLDSPPGFGFRGTARRWIDHLHAARRRRRGFAEVADAAAGARRDRRSCSRGRRTRGATRMQAWGLLEAPYGVAARPSPALRKQLDDARTQRIADELARLAEAVRARQTRRRRSRATRPTTTPRPRSSRHAQKASTLPPLVASPPMTLDDALAVRDRRDRPACRTFAATFDSMAERARSSSRSTLDAVAIAPTISCSSPRCPTLLSRSRRDRRRQADRRRRDERAAAQGDPRADVVLHRQHRARGASSSSSPARATAPARRRPRSAGCGA